MRKMKKINKLAIVILAFSSLALFLNANAQAEDWSYGDKNGPDKWADLAPENTLCNSGKNQSPLAIDVKETAKIQTKGIKFDYGMTLPETLSNTGNMIQLNTRGWAKLKADGIEFKLKRIDFHIPSEHTVNGKRFPMELQLVHQSEDNEIAIVSRMAIPGRPDRMISKVLEHLPMQAGQTEKLPKNVLKTMEMKKKYGNYFRYNGSTTMPPCSEGVRWYIMKQPMSFSKEQYEALKKAVPQDNNRPLQKPFARLILE